MDKLVIAIYKNTTYARTVLVMVKVKNAQLKIKLKII